MDSKKTRRRSPHVLCHHLPWPKEAQILLEELRKIGHPFCPPRHRDQFDFSPGITITNIHQVKGLEFRNVLIVDPAEENIPSGK
jgi:superfamily I DNA/RNA helicase